MLKGQLFIFLVIYIDNSSCTIDALYNAGEELWELYSMIDKLTLNTTEGIKVVDQMLSATHTKKSDIKTQMEIIYEQLYQLDESIKPKIIQYSFKLLPSEVLLYNSIDVIEQHVHAIDKYYGEFHDCMNLSDYHVNDLLQTIVRKIMLDGEGYIAIIRRIITGANDFLPNDKNLVQGLTDYAKSQYNQLCDRPYPISDILVKLFKVALIAEIKSNVMLAYVNLHRYPLGAGWKIINSLDRVQFQKKFKIYLDLFELSIKETDGLYLRACDPDDHIWIRDKSFYELEGTFNTAIFRYSWAACKHDSCHNVWFNKAYQCLPTYYDIHTSCSTTLTDCIYLGAIEACVLGHNHYKFMYVNSTELGFLGKRSRCPRNSGYKIIDGVGWNFTHAACACNCDMKNNKISLAIIESNIKSNMVITGVRFVRKNDILYIQPREGKLMANGYVQRFTQRWVPIANERQTSEVHFIDTENRVFFLDDLHFPSGLVLTGIKFNHVTRGTIKGFAIQIHGVPFDYNSGKLNSQSKYKIFRVESNIFPGKPVSFIPRSSQRTLLYHTPTSSTGYVSLQQSTLKDNFGQSTLPYFDGVPVTTVSSLLGGVGIFHKGIEGYAGFISLRVYGIKYTKYFSDFKMNYVKNDEVIFHHA